MASYTFSTLTYSLSVLKKKKKKKEDEEEIEQNLNKLDKFITFLARGTDRILTCI